MGRRAKQTGYVALVEACYRDIESDQEWLAQLFTSACPLLDLGGGVGLSLVQERPHERAITLSGGVGGVHDILQPSWPVIQQLDAATYQGFFYPDKAVVLASSLVSNFAQPAKLTFSSLMAQAGASDLLGMLGYPAQGWAFAMFVGVGKAPLTPQLHKTLRQLRIHIETSLRLRLFSSFEPAAVLRPDGKILHLDVDALGDAGGATLSAQTVALEQARSAPGRRDEPRALAVWKALVHGRWSLIERVDHDGQRLYHAIENSPHVHPQRALTETEERVLELSVRGGTGKEIAYELDLSQSRISEALKSARERLGVRDLGALLQLGARLNKLLPPLSTTKLTEAEREVLAMIRQGDANTQIARRRGSAPNTVRNQISNILRKTGAPSRRVLQLGEL
ncbi:MAG: LuxR C-terminal-related transcriptional regulator [Polyangiales bacterium]